MISVGLKMVNWHKIVWERFYGPVPEGYELDHRDNDRANSRVQNLALLTRVDNLRKRGASRVNDTGYLGVTRPLSTSKFLAQISHQRRVIYLGMHKTALGAFEAYVRAKAELHGLPALSPIEAQVRQELPAVAAELWA